MQKTEFANNDGKKDNSMRTILIIILIIAGLPSFSETITGEVKKETKKNINQIYDNQTNIPLEGVLIKIPSKDYQTVTKKDGSFKLQTKIDSPTIMSVEKSGYKPYSMTLQTSAANPIQVGIEKTTPNDIIVDTNMIHLGDDSFSVRSANASEFSLNSLGSFYTKDFKIKKLEPKEEAVLVIGSIIGIDTIQAQRLEQSKVLTAYASPPEVFFNGNKVAEIKINGDNQKINIPKELIKQNASNNVTVKAGRNLYKTSAIDFDDIEFTNLIIEIQ